MSKMRFSIIITILTALLIFGEMLPTTSYAAVKTVNHTQPLKVGEYMEPIEGYTFDVSDKMTVIEGDRYIIYVAPGIYVGRNFEKNLNIIMDVIEDTTGCSFMPENIYGNSYLPYGQKVEVQLAFSELTEYGATVEYASDFGVHLFAEEACADELSSSSYSTIVHELLHTIQIRNYGYLANIVTEGFAESYTGTIELILRDKYGFDIVPNERNNEIICINAYGRNECNLDVDYDTSWVTAENVEKYFFLEPGHSGHEPSYWIVEFIREKYGEEGFRKLMDNLGKASAEYANNTTGIFITHSLPNAKEYEVIKSTFSDNIAIEFYNWFKKQNLQDGDNNYKNLVNTKKVEVGINCSVSYTGYPIMEYPSVFKYRDSIEFDFTRAFAFCQQVLQVDCKGIVGNFIGRGRVDFYDQYGTIIYTLGSESSYVSEVVCVPYATRFVITGYGDNDFYIYSIFEKDFFSDSEFDDVSCTDASIVTYTVFERKQYMSFTDARKELYSGVTVKGTDSGYVYEEVEKSTPITKKVKTAKALKEALEEADGRGGKITITANITLDEHVIIPEDTTVVIKKGKKLTLKNCLDINGTLSGSENSVVFDNGWLWLNEASKWKQGKITFTSKIKKTFPNDAEYSCGIRIDELHRDGKLRVQFGLYNTLYISAPKSTKLENVLYFENLRDGFSVYLNKKKLTAKKVKKLTYKP